MIRIVAAILALVVLAPVGASAAVCSAAGFDGVMSADCCCGNGAAAKEAPAEPRIEGVCCCEIDRPAPVSAERNPAAVESAPVPHGAAVVAVAIDVAPPLASRPRLPDAPARAPPAGGWSLLAQGTSLLR